MRRRQWRRLAPPTVGSGSGKSAYLGDLAKIGDYRCLHVCLLPGVSNEMVSDGNHRPGGRGYGKMVSMKTKSEAVAEIGGLLDVLVDKFETDDDAERDYLVEHCPARLHPALRELPTMGIHLMAKIADGASNIVGLATASGQLKGTVSKHIQRLVEVGLVERGPVPGNRKEIRLSLTDDGRVLERVHRQMHTEMEHGLADFFLRYTGAELQTVAKVLGDLLRAERRGVRLVVDTDR